MLDLIVSAVSAESPNVRQPPIALLGRTGISKGLRLKRASARVPEIGCARQPQSMPFAAKRNLRHRRDVHRAVQILVVHHMVKGKTRIRTRVGRSWKNVLCQELFGSPSARRAGTSSPRSQRRSKSFTGVVWVLTSAMWSAASSFSSLTALHVRLLWVLSF